MLRFSPRSISVSFLAGGKIVSSKPFAPLNFRINSRNLSGKYKSLYNMIPLQKDGTMVKKKKRERHGKKHYYHGSVLDFANIESVWWLFSDKKC